MIDSRHKTLLTLSACGSFTKTAKILHITQPAVSQHIKYLEELYGVKLVDTSKRTVSLTAQGELLKEYATTVFSDSKHLLKNIQAGETEAMSFSFGATLSIGEYVMPEILSKILLKYSDIKIHMTVANTQTLLEQLNEGELDFIVVEGLFDKYHYDSTLFSREKFIPVCSARSDLLYETVDFERLIEHRLIVRERGSGTREIFENILQKNNYTLQAFDKVIEIGNMAAIKEMVANDIGITFLFEAAAGKDIASGKLALIDIPDFDEHFEFNYVFLKNSCFRERYLKILELFTRER